MHIAFDIDEVTADLNTQLILFHNETYGTKLTRDDFNTYFYEDIWGGTLKEAIKKIDEFIESKYFKQILPTPGSQKALTFLKKQGLTLHSVTGRIHSLKKETAEWTQKYFPDIFSGIHHANTYGTNGIKINKSKICKDLNISTLVDDDMVHVMDCANSGISVLVYDHPWNRVVLPQKAKRVLDYDEIIKEIISS